MADNYVFDPHTELQFANNRIQTLEAEVERLLKENAALKSQLRCNSVEVAHEEAAKSEQVFGSE